MHMKNNGRGLDAHARAWLTRLCDRTAQHRARLDGLSDSDLTAAKGRAENAFAAAKVAPDLVASAEGMLDAVAVLTAVHELRSPRRRLQAAP